MHYACAGPYLKCVELLIRSGAEINEANYSDSSRKLKTGSDEAKEANLNASANGNSSSLNSGSGCTPLMLACAFDHEGCIVRELIFNAHARANLTDAKGYTALHYAAFQGNVHVFEIVISATI